MDEIIQYASFQMGLTHCPPGPSVWKHFDAGVAEVRRAFAQGVSDHGSGTFVSTIVSTLSLSTFVSTVNDFQEPIQFLQRFNSPVSFSTPISSPVHFCLEESQTVPQLLLKQLFLVCTART